MSLHMSNRFFLFLCASLAVVCFLLTNFNNDNGHAAVLQYVSAEKTVHGPQETQEAAGTNTRLLEEEEEEDEEEQNYDVQEEEEEAATKEVSRRRLPPFRAAQGAVSPAATSYVFDRGDSMHPLPPRNHHHHHRHHHDHHHSGGNYSPGYYVPPGRPVPLSASRRLVTEEVERKGEVEGEKTQPRMLGPYYGSHGSYDSYGGGHHHHHHHHHDDDDYGRRGGYGGYHGGYGGYRGGYGGNYGGYGGYPGGIYVSMGRYRRI